MSGPKLVGLTCNPEVIARNNERLKSIGKERYFGGIFNNLNTDIRNVESWINNYAKLTLDKIPKDYEDVSGIIEEIRKIKKEHMKKVDSELINMSIISTMSTEQLNSLGVKKVKNIPEWKKQFILDVSKLLRELQEDIDKFKKGIKQREIANKECENKINQIIESSNRVVQSMNNTAIKALYADEYTGDCKNILNTPQAELLKEVKMKSKMLPFSLEELALIEMFNMDLEEFKKFPYITDHERKMIANMSEDLMKISEENSTFSMISKRAILERIKLTYQSLSCEISELTALHNIEQEQKSVLILDYVSFCAALDLKCENYDEWSIEDLRSKVEQLRPAVEKQEERIYIEETVENIMQDYGYSGISSHNLHDTDKTSQIIFEDQAGAKISTSFGDGMILINVVGEGDNAPTTEEIRQQVQQQEAFCTLYPRIREQLKKRGITIQSESLMPASEKYTTNIKIDRQGDINKSTRKFSFRHMPHVSYNDENDNNYYQESELKYQYMKQEE